MKNMEFDGIGYITGRGLSKYWGVSKQVAVSGGVDPWVVKFADPYIKAGNANRYRILVASEFHMKEGDAAKVAAYFHENPMPFANYPILVHFDSINPNYVLLVNTRTKKIQRHSKKVEKFDPKVIDFPLPKKDDFFTSKTMLDDILASDVAAEKTPATPTKPEPTEYEKGFAAGFALNDIIRSKLGDTGLKSILEAIEKRLKDK